MIPRGIWGAMGLVAGCLISVVFFDATFKHIGPILLAAALLIGFHSIRFLIELGKRDANG